MRHRRELEIRSVLGHRGNDFVDESAHRSARSNCSPRTFRGLGFASQVATKQSFASTDERFAVIVERITSGGNLIPRPSLHFPQPSPSHLRIGENTTVNQTNDNPSGEGISVGNVLSGTFPPAKGDVEEYHAPGAVADVKQCGAIVLSFGVGHDAAIRFRLNASLLARSSKPVFGTRPKRDNRHFFGATERVATVLERKMD